MNDTERDARVGPLARQRADGCPSHQGRWISNIELIRFDDPANSIGTCDLVAADGPDQIGLPVESPGPTGRGLSEVRPKCGSVFEVSDYA